MKSLSVLGKYLDQPRLVGNFSRAVPAILVAGGVAYTYDNVRKSPAGQKEKELVKSSSVIIGTIASALLATRGMGNIKIGGKTIFKGFEGLSERIDLRKVQREQTELVDEFLENNEVSKNAKRILHKSKSKILSFSQIKTIFEELGVCENGKRFLNTFIPNPEDIDSKEIFSEIGRLSVMGLVPVLGGIAGGVVGDKLTDNNWKDKIPNKVKEGTYQYLANIFLCNVGAGVALWAMEKAKFNSKPARAIGMITGIILAGVVFGSAVANMVGKVFVDPLFGKKNKENEGLYSQRKPEALDIGLHVDDVATVAVLSGLKWIEPALPILYSVSGYRSGIGYRNGDEQNN